MRHLSNFVHGQYFPAVEPKISQSIATFLHLMSKKTESIDTMASFDDTDRQLIAELRTNARVTVAALAKRLGVSRATVQNRMAKLEAGGTITGYTVRLRPEAEAQAIRAWMSLAAEGKIVEELIAELRGEPAVVELHSTNGRWDIVLELRTDSLAAFDTVLRRIGQLKGVAHTETSLLLTTLK